MAFEKLRRTLEELRSRTGDDGTWAEVAATLDEAEKHAEQTEVKYRRAGREKMAIYSLLKQTTDDLTSAVEASKASEDRYRRIFEDAVFGIFQSTMDGKVLSVNPAFAAMFGFGSPEEVIRSVSDAGIELYADRGARSEMIRSVLAVSGHRAFEQVFRRKDGSTFHGAVSIQLVRDPDGNPKHLEGFIEDVSKRKRVEQSLLLVQKAVDCAGDAIAMSDATGCHIYQNRAFSKQFGYSGEELAGPLGRRILYEDRKLADQVHEAVMRGESWAGEAVVAARDGRHFPVSVRVDAIRDDEGKILGRVAIYTDISDRREAENRLARTHEELTAMVRQLEKRHTMTAMLTEMGELLQSCSHSDEIPQVVRTSLLSMIPDAQGAMYLLSPSRTDLESVARWGEDFDDADGGVFEPADCWALRRGRIHSVESVATGLICPHLRQASIAESVCLPLSARGEVLGLLHLRRSSGCPASAASSAESLVEATAGIAEVVSLSMANVRLRETLSQQSVRDPLTGMFNRRYMEESLTREISRAIRKRSQVGVVMVDIDRFKNFNDQFGHAAGDEVLVQVGRFLAKSIRCEDIACRFGGEEFTLILPDCNDTGNVIRRANQLRTAVAALRVPYLDQSLSVTLSMGVATFPVHGSSPRELLGAADAALYRAKQEGRDRVCGAAMPAPAPG